MSPAVAYVHVAVRVRAFALWRIFVTFADPGSSHTNWSLIFEAAQGDPAAASAAIERLVRRYWPAVYAYIRQSGRNVNDASDLTQAFVCDVVLHRNLFQKADPSRGKFRTFLLRSLENFLRDNHRHNMRAKRSAANAPLRLTNADLNTAEIAKDLTPEQAFARQWNTTMIRRALERVRAGCIASGLDVHWRVFEARVVKPMLFGDERVSYSKLVERLELDDAGQAANMMVTVKRRFVRALVEEIGCTVGDPMQVEEELRELLRQVESHQ
jgi:RNA polymerase sigma factor (sigma-70 family)